LRIAFEGYKYRPCLGYRPEISKDNFGDYRWITYQEVQSLALSFGNGIRNILGKERDFVGIYSFNCAEWFVADIGLLWKNFVTVPIHHTLDAESVSWIIKNASLSCVVCSKENLDVIVQVVNSSSRPECLKSIVYIDQPYVQKRGENKNDMDINTEFTFPEAKKSNERKFDSLTFHKFSDIITRGQQIGTNEISQNTPQEIKTLVYTSGSTGKPKGLNFKFTFRNFHSKFTQEPYSLNICGAIASVTVRVIALTPLFIIAKVFF
jgi:long-chain acyl-CoA synthetase